MLIQDLSSMVEAAKDRGPVPAAVVAADDPEVLTSLVEAQQAGIVRGHLVGDCTTIEAIAQREQLDLRGMTLIQESDHARAARCAVAMVRNGEASIVVKGQLKTAEFLAPVLDRDEGLRTRKLLSHVAIFEIPNRGRLLYISDSGVVLYPTWEQKLEIIRGVVDLAHHFGIPTPKVAILGSTERISPSQPVGVEALMLSKMAEQGWVENAIVEGPLSIDVALNPRAAHVKGLRTAMAGTADILIVPSVESGNIMCKAMQYFAGARMAGLIIGARAPIIINSRADDAETRFLSLAMAALWSQCESGAVPIRPL